MQHANDWIRESPDWFRSYFGQKDSTWTDHRFPGSPRAPTGPPGSSRSSSTEESNLVRVDPRRLNLHISYSEGLENGPIIQRSGDSSPVMEHLGDLGSYTTDPDLQRLGSYYITEERKRAHIRDIFYRFVGSYIMYSDLVGVPKAKEEAKNIMLNYYTEVGIESFEELLSKARLEMTHLAGDIVGQIGSLTGFIASNGIDLTALFETPLNNAALEHEATRSMGDLYRKSYPHFDDGYAELRTRRGFIDTVAYNANKYLKLLMFLIKTPSHERIIRDRSQGRLLLIQGCGDLTMNEWNIAFICNEYQATDRDRSDGWKLLYPSGEPLNDRTYTCLIKWRLPRNDERLISLSERTRVVYPYQIAQVRFKAPSLEIGPADRHVFLDGEPIGHMIEFAVYGQQLVRAGELVRLHSVVHEFGDIRHIYMLPNINRDDDYRQESEDLGIPEYAQVPRSLFNQRTRDDVWLGEAALIQGDRNLRVAALEQSIQLDKRQLGAPEEWIDIVLAREDKKLFTYSQADPVLFSGQWRWVAEGRRKWLEVFFLRARYPCTMIGVKAADEGRSSRIQQGLVDTEHVFFLAHGHNYDWQGCSLEETAEYLRDQGSWNALLFDEGNDVFQMVSAPLTNELKERVPLKRNQLRCVFWAEENASEDQGARS